LQRILINGLGNKYSNNEGYYSNKLVYEKWLILLWNVLNTINNILNVDNYYFYKI